MVSFKTMFVMSISLATTLFSEEIKDLGGGVGVKSLPTITVDSSIKNPSSTEHSNSYTSNIVEIGKGNTTLKEIPQSVSIVTRQRLDDQNLQTLAKAMGQTPGVIIAPYGNGVTEFTIRGYPVDRYEFDSLSIKGGGTSFRDSAFDTALFDHIEVLKGPAGLLQGAGEPGGAINMVRKRALRDFSASGALSGGSWSSYRGEADVSGAFDKEGNFRGRLVAVEDDRKSYIDETYSDKTIVYGTLEYDFTPYTTLSIGGTYAKGKSMPNFGLPTGNGYVLDLPRSTFLGDTWDRQTEDTKRYFADLEHHLSNGGEIRFAANAINQKTSSKRSSRGASFPDPLTGDIRINQYNTDNEMKDRIIDGYITTPFELLGQSHNILLGASHYNSYYVWDSLKIGSAVKNVFNPVHNLPEPDWNPNATPGYITRTIENAMYGQLRLKIIDDLTLIGGSRLSWWKQKLNDNAQKIKNNAKIVPYAGIIYDINNEYSLYSSYSKIFQPQEDVNINNEYINPRTGSQYEIGVKAGWFDGNLNGQIALFRINDENRAVEDLNNPDFSVAMGKVRSQGGEMEISGNIMPWWDILAGYTYTTTKYLIGNKEELGRMFAPNTPKHSFKVWSKHNISNLSLGYGVITSSSIYPYPWSGPEKPIQGNYAIFSAMLGYKINNNFDVALNLENIFDKKYFSYLNLSKSGNAYGDPRSFMFTLRGRY